jgi:hypothetical protein
MKAMNNTQRHPNLILEELSDLYELIRENETLLSKYSDKFSLRVRQRNFKEREAYLLIELRNSFERFRFDSFDFIIDGAPVEGHRISLSFFGNLMGNLQDIVSSISQSLSGKATFKGAIPNEILRASQLDLVATGIGSFRFIVSSHEPQITDSSAKMAFQRFSDLIECEDDRDKIRVVSDELGKRVIIKYRDFLESLYKNKADILLYDKVTTGNFKTQKISSELAKRIYDVILEAENIPEEFFVYKGFMGEISLFYFTFGFLIEESGTIITGKFDKALVNEVKKRLDTFTTAKFKVSTTINELDFSEKKEWILESFED